MTLTTYRDPKIRNILVAVVLFAVFLVTVCSLPQVVKTLGAGLLYLPSRLGLVEMVARDQVKAYEMQTSPPELIISRPGRYSVYTDDYDLLVLTDEINLEGAEPWLIVTDPATGARVHITGVDRGLMPYDSPFAAGRPVFTFVMAETGTYALTFPRRTAVFYIVPDTTTGKERIIWLAYVVQLAVLALAVVLPYWRARARRRARLAAILPPRPPEADAFWKAESRRQRQATRRK
jgi:hypothetical protein